MKVEKLNHIGIHDCNNGCFGASMGQLSQIVLGSHCKYYFLMILNCFILICQGIPRIRIVAVGRAL